MKKSIVIITVIMLLMMTVLPLFNVHKAYAVTGAIASQALKPVVKRAIVPMLEKGGVQLAQKSAREKARSKWIGDLVQKYDIEQAENKALYENLLNALEQTPTPIPEKPGVGKIAIDTALFLTGLDLFTESYQAIEDAIVSQEKLDYITDNIEEGLQSGQYVDSYGAVHFEVGQGSALSICGAEDLCFGLLYSGTPITYAIVDVDILSTGKKFYYVYTWLDARGDEFSSSGSKTFSNLYIGESIISYKAVPTEETKPQSPPTVFPEDLPYLPPLIEIEVPLDDSGLDIQTYNEALDVPQPKFIPNPNYNPDLPIDPFTNPVYIPNPGYNPDNPFPGDITSDPEFDPSTGNIISPMYIPNPDFNPDIAPSGDNPKFIVNPNYRPEYEPIMDPTQDPAFEPIQGTLEGEPYDPINPPEYQPKPKTPNEYQKFKPWLLFLAFLDLLRALVMYLLRLIEYILTIPLIAAKELPAYTDGFNWFKSLNVNGINVFTIVMAFFNFVLGFGVYKLIQKIFNGSSG